MSNYFENALKNARIKSLHPSVLCENGSEQTSQVPRAFPFSVHIYANLPSL